MAEPAEYGAGGGGAAAAPVEQAREDEDATRADGLGGARGCLVGLVICAPFWLVVGLLVVWLVVR